MDHFAGLDVSVKETSVCIVDDTGKIVREVKVASEPEDLLQILSNPAYHFKRIGLEAGPLSQWLFSALAEAGLPVICVETRHMTKPRAAMLVGNIGGPEGGDRVAGFRVLQLLPGIGPTTAGKILDEAEGRPSLNEVLPGFAVPNAAAEDWPAFAKLIGQRSASPCSASYSRSRPTSW
jgi:transposase